MSWRLDFNPQLLFVTRLPVFMVVYSTSACVLLNSAPSTVMTGCWHFDDHAQTLSCPALPPCIHPCCLFLKVAFFGGMYCECEPFFFRSTVGRVLRLSTLGKCTKKKHLCTLHLIYFMYAACTDGSKTRRSASQSTSQIQAVLYVVILTLRRSPVLFKMSEIVKNLSAKYQFDDCEWVD